jgi:plasmid replication initiation protein
MDFAAMLLPDRHPIRDFFVLDVMDVAPRSDMATMEHPIFSLSTKPETRTLAYEHNGAKLQIIPSSIGLPTIHDKDLLIYCISRLVHAKNAGTAITPCVRLTTHDMLVQTNRPTNNLGYERLLPALNRLRGVVINTTIKTGDVMSTRGFGLIDEFEYNRKGSMFADRLQFLEIKLSSWLFRAIDACEVLPISRDYFRLRRPIDRRLYELARKHCGHQPVWKVSLDVLQKKTGSSAPRKRFAFALRGLAASGHLPDYAITVDDDKVTFQPHGRGGVAVPEVEVAPQLALALPASATLPLPLRHRITERGLDGLRDACKGWDRQWLMLQYIAFMDDKAAPRDADASLIAWGRAFTKGRPPG